MTAEVRYPVDVFLIAPSFSATLNAAQDLTFPTLFSVAKSLTLTLLSAGSNDTFFSSVATSGS